MIKVFALGRLTADPSLEQLNVGEGKTADLLKFDIAVNEYRTVNGEKVKYTHFFNCEAWDSGARVIAEQCHKGDLVALDGKLRQNRWKNKEGQGRSRVVLRVENFTIANRVNRGETSDDKPTEPVNEGNDGGGDEAPPF